MLCMYVSLLLFYLFIYLLKNSTRTITVKFLILKMNAGHFRSIFFSEIIVVHDKILTTTNCIICLFAFTFHEIENNICLCLCVRYQKITKLLVILRNVIILNVIFITIF